MRILPPITSKNNKNGARCVHIERHLIFKGETCSALSSAPEMMMSAGSHELAVLFYYPSALKR
jgi:hypothetical protein